MAPFPEAEDMTIKRLYVALKRSDMQLLQMGAHKLHEKYHTGHKFELLEDLKQILLYVEEQSIPNDIKDLLTRTINDILNGEAPKNLNQNENFDNSFETIGNENVEGKQNNLFDLKSTENNSQAEESQNNIYQNFNSENEAEIKEAQPFIDVIYPEKTSVPQNLQFDENIQNVYNPTTATNNEHVFEKEEEKIENKDFEPAYHQERFEFSKPEEQIQEEIKNENQAEETREDNQIEAEPVIFEENKLKEETKNEPEQDFQPQEQNNEEIQNEYQSQEISQPIQNENSFENHIEEKIETPEETQKIILEEKTSTLGNVAVFYDDKASFIDYAQNKLYRSELDYITLNKEASPSETVSSVKALLDIQTDEISEILKMLNTIKGQVYFVTSSKSENIIKTFIEHYINFEIPLVCEGQDGQKAVRIIPLFGLTNVFICPKCYKREYFGGVHNKILTMQCKDCGHAMYPDVYEAENYQTNANPYYFLKGINSMANADVWILINPPMENNRALVFEFLKTSFEVSKPKKVYILSKETTKKEYYRQIFQELNPSCNIKCDFITQDSLCEDFINSEMSTLKVNI